MDWLTWTLIIGFPVVLTAVVIVEVTRRGCIAFVYDGFRKIYKYRASVKDGKVLFRYNQQSEAGVAFEDNEYRLGKKKLFKFLDVDGTLLPVTIKDYNKASKWAELDLSTSQEKLYETEALKAIAEKISDTWWEKNKLLVFGAFIIMIAFLIFIITMKFAMDIEPVPEPTWDLVRSIAQSLQNVSQSNQAIVDQISQQGSGGGPPR